MWDDETILLRKHSVRDGTEHRRLHYTLPPEERAKARSRLAFLTLVFGIMCVLGVVIDQTIYRDSVFALTPVYVFNLVTSALLFIMTRIKSLGDRTISNFSLVYEVLMCLSVALGFGHADYLRTSEPSTVSWVCIVMVAYPLIIPTSPRRTFWAALLAASTVPASIYLLQVFAEVEPRAFDYLHVSLSPIFCVLLAVLGSRVVYGLNVEVARAQRMGSYQLVELLGRGGMGEVWRAQHRLLARPAAVKLVRPEVRDTLSSGGSDRLLERFKREAQVTAGLESPHTVSLYDFGVTDQGVFYYVMELLTGLDLETLVLKHGPLPPDRCVHVLLQACHSLREAHDQGLIHRDVKPANLVLCRQLGGDYDVVKVLDFGMVALRPESHPEDTRLTAEDQIGGTPACLPPEVVEGERVDARADIYSLGCVAYWLLTGHQVFERKNPMKTILAHLQEAPEPPSKRSDVEISSALEELILDCLEKDPDRRPQNAEDLAQRLRATGLAPAWTQEMAREWWQNHRPEAPPDQSAEPTIESREGRPFR
jgi:serine/threonine-protein kinase